MPALKKILGINLRYYRNLENLSQEKYYGKYNLSVKHLANVERGKENVTLDFVDKLSKILDIPTIELLTYDKNKVIIKKRVDQTCRSKNKPINNGLFLLFFSFIFKL